MAGSCSAFGERTAKASTGAFIAEAIRSVLAQSYTDYKLIVVDDGSVDQTYAQASRFGERATLIRQPNRDISDSRNTGIQHAKGETLGLPRWR
jgi:glycosyltransferase involved in cell wall biosynthesis